MSTEELVSLLRNAATWVTGPRSRKLSDAADRLEQDGEPVEDHQTPADHTSPGDDLQDE